MSTVFNSGSRTRLQWQTRSMEDFVQDFNENTSPEKLMENVHASFAAEAFASVIEDHEDEIGRESPLRVIIF